MRLHGGGRWRGRASACLLAAAAALSMVAAVPAASDGATSTEVSLTGLGEGTLVPEARLGAVHAGAHQAPAQAALRAGKRPPRRRKGISLTPSATEPHWLCPDEACDAIVAPPPVPVEVDGKTRFAVPGGGPLTEGSGEKGGFDPKDLQSAYKIPATGGEGQTVALVDAYGYPNAEENLAKYRERYGLPPCTKANGCFKKVNQKGEEANYPPSKGGWEGESALDIEMVSAACPACHIMLAQANSATTESLAETVNTAARLGATEISNSYGLEEQYCTSACETTAHDYDHPGIMITAAAGDEGYDGYQVGAESAEHPANLPWVVAVGGTALHKADNARGWTEEAWKDGGSGCSTTQPKPVWQTDTGCAGRMEDDVAADASCETAVSVYATIFKGWENICGTSVSTPLVAAIEAHAPEYARSLPGADAFYEDPEAINDVTTGSNGTCTPPASHAYFCHAEVGYDGPTGNGTPNGPLTLSGPPPPVVKTQPANGVAHGEATLNGEVDPEGLESTYHFEYGTSTSYGTSVPAPDAAAGSGRTAVSVSQAVTGLVPETSYHYRLVATNANGTSYGADSEFITAPPTVTSVTPGFGPTDGGTTVTITGTNLASALKVRFGSREAEYFAVLSPTTISAVTPLGAGALDVTVSTPAGTSEASSADRYVYDKVGPVLSWGYNQGLLGDSINAPSDVPVEVDELPEPVALAAGGTQSLALMGDGTVMAWGEGRLGSLGDGNDTTRDIPVAVCAPASKEQTKVEECPNGPYLDEVTAIAAGAFNSLALLKNGTVVAWGGNGRGQLGVGGNEESPGSSNVPVPVCTVNETPCKPENYLKEVSAIAAGERYSLALLKNGTVMAWGEDSEGELGRGTTKRPETCIEKTVQCSRIPVAVADLAGVGAISAGSYHALALLKDGNVMAWGADPEGELGDGATEQRDTPTAVCAVGELAPCNHDLDGVSAVSAGLYTSMALLGNGAVVDWGSNFNGGLGDGSFSGPETCGSEQESCSRSPVAVSGLSEVAAIATGPEQTASTAVTRAGELLTWGGDSFGQLGDGTMSASDAPVHVCQAFATEACPDGPYLGGEVTAISAGGDHDLVSLRTSLTSITGVSPDMGPGAGGSTVTITGANLGDVTAVNFGAARAREFEVKSASEIVAVSPPGSGVVNVTVITPEGASHVSLADEFSYETSTVTGVSPAEGSTAGGTPVTITGTKLSEASAVHFGAAAASEFEVKSASEIVAVAPPGTGVVDVTVTTPDGTSPPTPADQFLYQGSPTVHTEPASAVHVASATLNATVNPEGANVSDCHFEYGTSPAYGSSVPCASPPGSGSSPVPASALVRGLARGTSYHFRIVAINANGSSYGTDEAFATPASELPELGRCVKLSAASGGYRNAACTTASAGGDTGKYEWRFGPGPKDHFSAKAGTTELESTNNAGNPVAALQCTEAAIAGEYTGPQSASLTLALSGCTSPYFFSQKCKSEGASEGDITATVQATLGIISAATKSLGWDLQPASGSDLATFECAGLPLALTGSIIGRVTKADVMSSLFSLTFKGSKGKQVPERFESGLTDVPHLSYLEKSVALVMTNAITSEEKLELKAIQ